MSLPPKEAEKAEKEVTNMEDSGHGQDIGSDTLLGDARVMDKYCIAQSGNFPLRRAFNHSASINAQKIAT